MAAPIVVYRPILHLQPLTELGADDGAAVDVSCDIGSVELSPDAPVVDVSTFCGNFTIPEDITVGATIGFVISDDSDANWAPLVGRRCRAELWDTNNATRYRTFETQVMLNPSLYGPTTPGEPRAFDVEFAVLSEVEWVDES